MKIIRSSSMILSALLLCAGISMAHAIVPDGTPIRVRLESSLSAETNQLGDAVEFSVTEDVRVGDAVVVAKGARATGSIVKLSRRGHLGKSAELNFSIERVQAADGNWLDVRYMAQPNNRTSGTKAGILGPPFFGTFPAPLGVCTLPKNLERQWAKGRTFAVFTQEPAETPHP